MQKRPELCLPSYLGWAFLGADTYLTATSLALDVLHLANQGQVEACAEAVLQEERGAWAVKPSLGDDGDAVPQEVCLVHVVGRHDDGSACGVEKSGESQVVRIWQRMRATSWIYGPQTGR